MTTFRWLGLFMVTAALTTSGCALDTSDEDDDDDDDLEDYASVTQALQENGSNSDKKYCVKVKRETSLFDTSGGNNRVVSDTLAKGRYVLVQPNPGRVGTDGGGRVWVDADLYGLRVPAEPKKPAAGATAIQLSQYGAKVNARKKSQRELADRCSGLKKGNNPDVAKIDAVMSAKKIVFRGWVNVTDLTGGLERLKAKDPNGPKFESTDYYKDKLDAREPRTVKNDCAINGDYRGSDPTNPAGMTTYGTKGQPRIYLSYAPPDTAGGGGGVSFGYLRSGTRVYRLDSQPHLQKAVKGDSHCQVATKVTVGEGAVAPCNGDVPAAERDPVVEWSSVWVQAGSRTLRGWVPDACLTK